MVIFASAFINLNLSHFVCMYAANLTIKVFHPEIKAKPLYLQCQIFWLETPTKNMWECFYSRCNLDLTKEFCNWLFEGCPKKELLSLTAAKILFTLVEVVIWNELL